MHVIHFVPVGRAGIDFHLAGIPKFGADEVVLFSTKVNSSVSSHILDSLRKIGVESRLVHVEDGYLEPFRKAGEEAAACLAEDICVGVNMSTDAEALGSAVEDAVRLQLFHFHKRSLRETNCSAFRYFVNIEEKPVFHVAPMWNFFNETHNDIFEILADTEHFAKTKDPIPLKKLWESYALLRPEPGGQEAFRKVFRDFKCWMRNNPCFVERLHKSPRYKIQL